MSYKIYEYQVNQYKGIRIVLEDFTKNYIERKGYSIYDNIQSVLTNDREYVDEKIKLFDAAILENFDDILAFDYSIMIDDWDDNVLKSLQQRHTNLSIGKTRDKMGVL